MTSPRTPYRLESLATVFPNEGAGTFGLYAYPPEQVWVAVVEGDYHYEAGGVVTIDSLFGGEIAAPDDEKIVGALLVTGDLLLPDATFCDLDPDWSPALIVRGHLRARALALSGGEHEIHGDCVVRDAIYGYYNHGSLRVHGTTKAAWVIANEYGMHLDGAIDSQHDGSHAEGLTRIATQLAEDFVGANNRLLHDELLEAVLTGANLARPPRSRKSQKKCATIPIPKALRQQFETWEKQEADGKPVLRINIRANIKALPDALRQFTRVCSQLSE